MGKAARHRKESRMKYLVRLSYEDPQRFEYEWEKRLGSWLTHIRFLGDAWRNGEDSSRERIFDVLDEAMMILMKCPGPIFNKLAPKTFSLISHECCVKASAVIDPRLYRLSLFNKLQNGNPGGR